MEDAFTLSLLRRILLTSIARFQGGFCARMQEVLEADIVVSALGDMSPYTAFMRPDTLLVEILPYPLRGSCTTSLLDKEGPNKVNGRN